jgi:hypothetical protein
MSRLAYFWDKKINSIREVEAEFIDGKWKAICPNHEDKNPSLEIDFEKGFYNCFPCEAAGNKFGGKLCDPPNEPDDSGEPDPLRRPIETYDYKSAGGNLLYQKLKYRTSNPPPHDKKFYYRRIDENGKEIWGTKGIQRVLYRLPELLSGCDPVFICEGEKDTDELRKLGFTVTTAGGATDWRKQFNPCFIGRDVIILPHNDSAGAGYADTVGNNLQGVAKSLRAALLPDLSEHGDVYDFLNIPGHQDIPKQQFLELVNELAKEFKDDHKNKYNFIEGKELITMETIEKEWLWDGVFPADGLGLTLGKPKVGKTTFDFNFAVAVSRGIPFLGRATKPGVVLFLALQENRDEVVKNMKRMGGNFDNFHVHFGMAPKEALEELVVEMENRKPILVVIEMLQNFMRFKKIEDYAEVTTKLEPVMDVSHRLKCFVLGSHHSPKMERELVDSALGSTGLIGGVDTAILIKKNINGRRSFSSIQRYRKPGVPDVENLVLNLCKDDVTLELGGSVQDEDSNKMKDEILKVLSNIGEGKFHTEPMTRDQIIEEIGKDRNLIIRCLKELYQEGRIKRIGAGVRSNPHKYSIERMR